MLKQDNLTFKNGILHLIHIVSVYIIICSCNYNNGIVILSNCYHSQSGRHSCNRLNAFCQDALLLKVFHKAFSRRIISDTSKHLNFCSKLCHSNSLIRSFSAGNVLKVPSFKSFSLKRDSLRLYGHIHIDTSNYSNFSHGPVSPFLILCFVL